MKFTWIAAISLGITIAACTTKIGARDFGTIPNKVYEQQQPSADVNLDFKRLKSLSCRAAADSKPFRSLTVEFEPVQPFDRSNLPADVSFAGGWQLKSNDPELLSFSGLHALSDLELLAVSDLGSFIRINLSNYEPTGSVQATDILGETGLPLRGGYLADAEGVTSKDGIAFVTFEQFHRVDAYALSECGSLARPARVAALPKILRGISVASDEGPKAISWLSNLVVLYSTMSEHAVLGMNLGSEERTDYHQAQLWNRDSKLSNPVVGITKLIRAPDKKDGWYYRLRRSVSDSNDHSFAIEVSHEFDRPLQSGNADFLVFELNGSDRMVNFEGVAAQALENGKHRLWLVSDNGESRQQPTVLYAFDVDPTYRTDGPGGRIVY